jgi:ABC-2 type transport system ATP-binding protein
MLLGLLYPTKGRISVFGKAPTDVSVKARIGFLPEESYLYRFLVAHETLDYYGRLFRLPSHARQERSDRLLDMVGLRHEAKRRVGEYSKGMARRIGLAQALINDPELLILDEPTSGLDPIGARQIKDVIRELGRKGKTILLSSHILADVEDVCDRVAILYGGQQRAAGDIGALLRKTDATQITAPSLSAQTIEQVRDLIWRLEKKDITEVSNPRARLEDFFLRIVEEAQAANIRTSGVLGGGEMPEFLQRPTESTTQEVVDSLVASASRKVEVVPPEARPLRTPESEPSREVIEELLGTGTSKTEVDEPGRDVKESPHAEPAPPRRPVSADTDVIDDLIGRADREGSEHSEDQG